MAFNFVWSHSGDGPFFTPRTTRPAKTGQASGLSISIFCGQGKLPLTGFTSGVINSPNPTAAKSRAILLTPSQSGRLGVTSKSITGSFKPSASAIGVPMARSWGKSIIPSASSPASSSLAEHIMPELSMPRILRGFLSREKSNPGI